jgi:site-specific recombinase XerD
MDDSTPTSSAIPATVAVPPVLDADNLIRVFTQFLTFDVADGAASAETITYLEQDEANRLLQGIDHSNELKLVRDRLLLGLMTIEGTRTVELYRCNLEDIKRLGQDVGLKLDGKRRVRTIPLRGEMSNRTESYAKAETLAV